MPGKHGGFIPHVRTSSEGRGGHVLSVNRPDNVTSEDPMRARSSSFRTRGMAAAVSPLESFRMGPRGSSPGSSLTP